MHPDAENISIEDLKRNLVPRDIKILTPLIIQMLNGENSEKNG